jgi:hypothetical protein
LSGCHCTAGIIVKSSSSLNHASGSCAGGVQEHRAAVEEWTQQLQDGVDVSGSKDVQCEYLAADGKLCTALTENEGQAVRNQHCSNRSKDLCCYFCDGKGSCDIGCDFLDQTLEEDVKGAQLSSTVSQGGAVESFACPFCGAPYRTLVPDGIVQVKCEYCGASVLVPPHLGGIVRRCSNHPDVAATGICNDCGSNSCRDCLRTYELQTRDAGATLYLCEGCYRSRRMKDANGSMFAGIMILLVGIMLVGVAIRIQEPIAIVMSILFLIVGIGALFFGVSQRTQVKEEISNWGNEKAD